MLINVDHINLSNPTTVLSEIGSAVSISSVHLANTHKTKSANISLLLRSREPSIDYYLIRRIEIMPSTTILFEDIKYDSNLHSLCVVSEKAPALYTLIVR